MGISLPRFLAHKLEMKLLDDARNIGRLPSHLKQTQMPLFPSRMASSFNGHLGWAGGLKFFYFCAVAPDDEDREDQQTADDG